MKKKLLIGVLWTSIHQFFSQVIHFFISIILARLLLPEDFGLVAIVLIFIAIGESLYRTGLSQSIVRSKNIDQDDYSTVFWFNMIGSIIIYSFIFLLSQIIARFYNELILSSLIRVSSLSIIIGAFSSLHNTRLTKEMNFKRLAIIDIPSILAMGIVGISLAYFGYGVWSLIWSNLARLFVSSVLLILNSKWTPSMKFKKEKFIVHFKFGYKMTLSRLLDTIFNNIYFMIIGKLFSPIQLGYYFRADTLKQYPVNNISIILNKVTYPFFAEIQDDNINLKKTYKEIMQLVFFLVTPILVLMAVLAKPIFLFLFTDKWLPSISYFQILCIAGIFHPLISYNLNILQVKGKSGLFLKIEIIKKIMTLIIILLSFSYGIYGLLWGQVILSFISFLINSHYAGIIINYSAFMQIKDIFPVILISLISGGSTYLLYKLLISILNNKFIFSLFLATIFFVLIYILISYIFKIKILKKFKIIGDFVK